MRVAVLGTGIMGFPIACNVSAAGIEVIAWNRTAEKAEPLREHGVEVADSPPAAIEGADLALTVLASADAVESVMAEQGDINLVDLLAHPLRGAGRAFLEATRLLVVEVD